MRMVDTALLVEIGNILCKVTNFRYDTAFQAGLRKSLERTENRLQKRKTQNRKDKSLQLFDWWLYTSGMNTRQMSNKL